MFRFIIAKAHAALSKLFPRRHRIRRRPSQPTCHRPKQNYSSHSSAASDDAPSGKDVSSTEQTHPATILRLPDELVLNIMNHLDTTDLFLLRHSAAVFFRLSCDRTFAKYHGPRLPNPPPQWNQNATGFDKDKAKRLTRKDIYCRPCRRTLNFDFAESSLFCSGCRRNHSRYLFSYEERSNPNRICIGRQGFVSLFPRWRMPWDLLQQYRTSGIACPGGLPASHSSYRSGEMKISLGLQKEILIVTREIPVFKLGVSNMATLDTVIRLCKASPSLENANAMFCPHVRLDDGQLLEAFDPVRCVCLQPDISCRQVRQLRMNPNYSVCLFFANKDPSRAGHLCPGPVHSHDFVCRECDTEYLWIRKESDMVIRCKSILPFSSPTSSRWLRLLDPASYCITNDPETKHSWWCPNPKCHMNKHWAKLSGKLKECGD